MRERLHAAIRTVGGRRGYRAAYAATWALRMRRASDDDPLHLLIPLVLRPGDVAVDVGAHAGAWASRMRRRVGAGGLVVSYEASPWYAEMLALALRWARFTGVAVRHAAVSDTAGTARLVVRDASGRRLTGFTHLAGESEAGGTVEVETVTLDGEADREPRLRTARLIKIDVEGAELAVLRGARRLLAEGSPVVVCEVVPEHLERLGATVEGVLSLMREHGYVAFAWSSAEGLRALPSGVVPHDVVFARPEVARELGAVR